MKQLSVLAALAFALGGSTVYACDYGVHAANATPVVVGNCGTGGCATDEPVTTTQEPIAKPEPATPQVAGCGTGNCATDDPPPPAPVTVAGCSGTSGC